MLYVNALYRRFSMSLDIAAFNASIVVSPHTKKKVTPQKLLSRKFILETEQEKEGRSDKAKHLVRQRELKRQAKAMSR